MDANVQADQVGQPAPAGLKQAAGSIRFDWVMIVLCGWLLAGVYIDGWAHNHFNIIDTFFTPWHAVLYSGFLSIALFLVGTLALNTRRGCFWWSAVPPGYGFSLVGVLVFGIGGISDFFWHTLFGFDVELATLLSPTHLMLAAGGVLIVSGPLRAAWLRPESAAKPRWLSQLPLVVSLTFVLGALAFMTSFAHPFVSLPATTRYNMVNSIYLNDLIETWGVLGILLQSGLLIGTMLLLIRRQRVPLGTFTVMFSISFSTASVLLGNYFLIPVAVLGGLAADIFYRLFRPSVERVGALRLFVFVVPVCLFALYFLDLRLFRTIWWPLTIWSGSIVMAGITGLLLSYLFVPPLRNDAKPAPSFLTSFQLTRRRMLIGLAGLGLAAGGVVVAGGLVLRRSRASDNGNQSVTGGPVYFYATGAQAILNVPALLRQASGAVNSLAWSPNGQWIASANSDGTVQIWPATVKAGAGGEGGALFIYRKHGKAVTGVAWSPDGQYIASASEDGTVLLWNASTGVTRLAYQGHSGSVLALAWSPDGGQIASAGEDKTVQIWDASSGARISTYRGHSEAVSAVAWSPDGKRIVSATAKGNARVWNAASAALISAFLIEVGSSNAVSVVWSPDGKYIASAMSNLTVWDASTGALLYLYVDESFDIISVAWSPDGKRFITGLANGSVYIWTSFLFQKTGGLPSFRESNVQSGRSSLLSGGGGDDSSTTAFLLLCNGHTGTVNGVAWSPDSIHAVSAGADGTLQFVDTSVGNTSMIYQNSLTSASWSPDGGSIASTVGSATVEIWDVASATAIITYRKHPSGSTITSLAWSPDGKKMISASDDGTVLIWDAQTGATLLSPPKQAVSIVEVTWLPDGKRVAMIDGQGMMQVWDAITGRVLVKSQKQKMQVLTAAWSPDNKRVAVVDENGQAQVWDAISGSVLLPPLLYLRGMTALAWTPNGKQLASAAGELVQVWDEATGEVLFSYQGDQSTVYDLTWAADGKRLAFTSGLGVQVWDVTRGTLLLTYRGLAGYPGAMYTVAWSPDGKSIASTSNDGSVQVWLASPVI